MGKPTTKTEVLITVRKEINKQFILFDGFNRPLQVFTAPIFAVDGDYCHVREYVYYVGTTIVKGRNEGYGIWLQAFDDALNPAHLLDNLGNILADNLGNQLTP